MICEMVQAVHFISAQQDWGRLYGVIPKSFNQVVDPQCNCSSHQCKKKDDNHRDCATTASPCVYKVNVNHWLSLLTYNGY